MTNTTFYLIPLRQIKKLSVEEKAALCPIINGDWVECDEQLNRWNNRGLTKEMWDYLNQLTCSDYQSCPIYQSLIKQKEILT